MQHRKQQLPYYHLHMRTYFKKLCTQECGEEYQITAVTALITEVTEQPQSVRKGFQQTKKLQKVNGRFTLQKPPTPLQKVNCM